MISIIPVTTPTHIHTLLQLGIDARMEDMQLGNMAVEPDEFVEQPMEFYISNNTFSGYFLCLEDANIVGYARLGLAFIGKRRMSHRYGLGPFYIDPKYRGRGHGYHFLSQMITTVTKSSIEKYLNIVLMVNTNNLCAIHNYKKCGFEIIGTEEKHIKLGENFLDCYIMQKIIEN